MGSINVNMRFQTLCIILTFLCCFATKLRTDPHVPKGRGIDLTKNPKKGEMKKLLKGRGILRRGDSVGMGGCC